jgi:hypothetical protein
MMVKQHRYSKKKLETMADVINSLTSHKVKLFFGVGCYVTIDEEEYSHYNKKEDCYVGLKNKEVAELLRPLSDEAIENWRKKNEYK